MKKFFMFTVLAALVFLNSTRGNAQSFRYQVDPTGGNRYAIQISSNVSEGSGDFFRAFKRKAAEVCQGNYTMIKLDPESTRSFFGIIECKTLGGIEYAPTPVPDPRTKTQVQQQRYMLPEQKQPVNRSIIQSQSSSNFSIRNRFGVGIITSAVNFGIGPSVEFWLGERLGIMGYASALFDYVSYGARLEILLDRPLSIFSSPTKPYLGVGYAGVQGPEFSSTLVKCEQDGNGAEVHAGLLHSASWLLDKLFLRGEFIFYTFDIDNTCSGTYSGTTRSDNADWSSFSLGLGVSYLF